MIATSVRLDIGAGANAQREAEERASKGLPCRPSGDWTTVDAFTAADVRAEMWALHFPDGSVDEIWSSHALEHVALVDVAPTLAEWFRVLRPGGKATIQVPNLDYACRYWLEHPGDPWALAILFGNQRHAGEFHRTGWSPTTFWRALTEAGFVSPSGGFPVAIVDDYAQETIRAEVSKP